MILIVLPAVLYFGGKKIGMDRFVGAYGVFVFHVPIIVGISTLLIGFDVPQLLKFVIVAPIALIVCFSFAWVVKQLPVFKKIF